MNRSIGVGALLLTLVLVLLDVGCGGPSAQYGGTYRQVRRGRAPSGAPADRSATASIEIASAQYERSSDSGGEVSVPLREEAEPERYAQAQTQPEAELTATDAVDTSRELLIYTALFHVAVYDVETSAASIAESARAIGGFVQREADDRIVVRVPAARFRAFITSVEAVGDILHREVEAQDVGEEFRDVEIRIRNLEQVRDQVAALLQRGLSVEQVLVVERELERVTAELESLRGRQRYLADRIAYSTVTVFFREAPRDQIDQPEIFQLPFSWLDSLGLSNLLTLR